MLGAVKNLVPSINLSEGWRRTRSFIRDYERPVVSGVVIPCVAFAVSGLVQKFFFSAPTEYSTDSKWIQPTGDPSTGSSEFTKSGQDFLNKRHKIFSFYPEAGFEGVKGLNACFSKSDFETFAVCAEKVGIPPWQINVPLLKKKFGDFPLTEKEGKELYVKIEKRFSYIYKRGKDCLDQTLIRTTLCNSARAYICGRMSVKEPSSICKPLQDGGDPVSLIGRYRSEYSEYGFIRDNGSARMCRGISRDGAQDHICHQNADLGSTRWGIWIKDLAVLSSDEIYEGFPNGPGYPDKDLPLISFTEPGKNYPEFESEARRI